MNMLQCFDLEAHKIFPIILVGDLEYEIVGIGLDTEIKVPLTIECMYFTFDAIVLAHEVGGFFEIDCWQVAIEQTDFYVGHLFVAFK